MRRLAALVLALAAGAVQAADVMPGLWEISLETRVAGAPDFAPPANRLSQCLTAQDARDPGRILGQFSNPGAGGCTYTERNYSGNTFRFAMQCSGAFALESRGSVTFTAQTMEGQFASTANVGGTAVQTQNRISARRVGSC